MRQLLIKMILRSFISLRAFTVYMENSLQFDISLWFAIYTDLYIHFKSADTYTRTVPIYK